MTAHWRMYPWALGTCAISVLAGCSSSANSPSPTAPPTASATSTLATPPPTAAANVLITACGSATVTAATPQFFTPPAGNASPVGSPPPSTEPVSEADVLGAVHVALINSALDHVNVTCVARQFPGSQAAPFITAPQPMTSTVWVVVARLTPNATATPSPDLGQAAGGSGANSVQYQIYVASNTAPVVMYGIAEYPPGLPLPTVFTGMG